jgi:hypothetical protein
MNMPTPDELPERLAKLASIYPTPAERLVKRLRSLVAEWRKEAADPTAGRARATLNMVARRVELILEDLDLQPAPVKGTALRPANDVNGHRACAFNRDFSSMCDARGAVWDLVLYDRAIVPDEPHNGIELRRLPCCFSHGAAEQSRRRLEDQTEEDR